MQDNGAYYRKRLADELAAAERATCPKAIAAHREMARRYAELIAALPATETETLPMAQSA